MISQSSRPGTRLRPGPISVRRNRAFRPASVLGLDELESRVVPSVTLSVTAYHADPTGVVDSTAAINAAIAAAAPGDTVYFPTGTYKISVTNSTSSGPSLVLKSGVTLQGNGQANSIIRLADHQRPYWGLIGGPGWRLSNFNMYDLTIDANGPNNPLTVDDTSTYPRVPVLAYSGTDIVIQRCRITNVLGTWAIGLHGPSHCTVDHCTIDNVSGGSVEFDHSSIYTSGDYFTITNDTFATRNGPGTVAGRTAIEIHGSYQTIAHNTINGYRDGVNACNNAPSGGNAQLYQYNTFTNCGTGILLWTFGSYPPLANCTIDSNTFTQNIDGQRFDSGSGYSAVQWDPGSQAGPIDHLYFTNNTVSWTNYSRTTRYNDYMTNAVQLVNYSGTGACTNVFIQNNRITNPMGSAINLETAINGLTITGNTITDPGSSPNTSLASYNRSAILLTHNMQNATIQSNTFRDDYSKNKMLYGIWEGTNNLGNCVYGGDQVQVTSGAVVPEFFSGSGHQGPAWTLSVPPSTSGGVLLSSDFASGNTSGWTPVWMPWVTGTWQAQASYNGVSNVYAKTGTATGVSLAGSSSWTNYTFTALVNLENLGGGIALLGRVQDATHYYQLEIKENSAGQVRWWIWKNNGGTWTNLASGPLSYTAGSWVNLGFTLSGSKLTAQMSPASASSNVTSLGSAVDSTWSAGGVGLRVWGSAGRFAQALVVAV